MALVLTRKEGEEIWCSTEEGERIVLIFERIRHEAGRPHYVRIKEQDGQSWICGPGEGVQIRDDILLTVNSITIHRGRRRVVVGMTAPQTVNIVRGELIYG